MFGQPVSFMNQINQEKNNRVKFDNSFTSKVSLETELSESLYETCLLYTSPSPRDKRQSRMPSSA